MAQYYLVGKEIQVHKADENMPQFFHLRYQIPVNEIEGAQPHTDDQVFLFETREAADIYRKSLIKSKTVYAYVRPIFLVEAPAPLDESEMQEETFNYSSLKPVTSHIKHFKNRAEYLKVNSSAQLSYRIATYGQLTPVYGEINQKMYNISGGTLIKGEYGQKPSSSHEKCLLM